MSDNWLPMPRYKLRKDLVGKLLRRESPGGKACLELGYGAGDMLLMYAALGLTVYGFDISEQAYENASLRICKAAGLKERIHLHPDEAGVHARKYDYVMAFEVLEHIEDDAACLREWWGLLNETGKLFISVPAHPGKWGANDVASGHYRRYEREGMSDLLRSTGFRVLDFWNYAYPISILLDTFLHKKYRAVSMDVSKEERSKQSGVRRENNVMNRVLASTICLLPFFVLQRCFLNLDLSSAYLIVAEKAPCNGRG